MADLKNKAKQKATEFIGNVISDPRWNLEDELMCQVLGFTLYGYVFGIGRIHCFLDVEDIDEIAVGQLAGLGIGRKYVEGMIQAAANKFAAEESSSIHGQLIGIGHSHALKENMDLLVESIFVNTSKLGNL